MIKDRAIRLMLTFLIAIALIGTVNAIVPEHITTNEQRRREKISENNARHWYGKKFSEEHKEKISIAMSGNINHSKVVN